ncbi:MAG: hypothetical protein ABR987_22515 [Terracidiphilus sp.]|jgi:hypothetical protein
MTKVSIKGVLLGGVVDVLSSLIFGVLFAVLVIVFFHVFGRVPHKTVTASPLFETSLIMIGVAGSTLGGFVAARLAKHDELLNAGLSSYLCVLLGIYEWSRGIDHSPSYAQALLMISGPVFSLLGGYLRLRQNQLGRLE